MRVNVYAEEMTNRVEIVKKGEFTGLRFYLELPVTVGGHGPERRDGTCLPTGKHRSVSGSEQVFPPINGKAAQVAGPFMHHFGDDDSAAVTFWGKRDLRKMLRKALKMLDRHYKRPLALRGRGR